jgi:hypothetical protein
VRSPDRLARRAADGGGEDGGSDGDGGSEPRVPPAMPPSPSGLEASPAWWPAFERQFAAYVRRSEHTGAGAQ